MGNNYMNRFLTSCFTLLFVSWSVAHKHYSLNCLVHHQHLNYSENKLGGKRFQTTAHCLLSVPTYQCPLSGADPHTVSCAGRELGPVGQLAVILAGELTSLSDGGHGLGEFQTLADVGLRPVQLATGHSWKD